MTDSLFQVSSWALSALISGRAACFDLNQRQVTASPTHLHDSACSQHGFWLGEKAVGLHEMLFHTCQRQMYLYLLHYPVHGDVTAFHPRLACES